MTDGSHLALVLPGGGYGAVGPALRVPALAVQQAGADVRTVPYPDERPGGLEEHDAKQFNAVVAGSVTEIIADGDWNRVTFIAKSRGTMVLAALDEAIASCDDVRAVWVTPIFEFEYVRRGAAAKSWPSLLIAGGADPSHDPAGHQAVAEKTGARSVIIDGANHLMEVPGDVVATIEGWRRVAAAVLEFAGEH